VPVLESAQATTLRDHVIGTFTHTQRMIADASAGNGSSTPKPGDQQQLFDLENRSARTPRIWPDDPAHQPQAQQLAAQLKSELKKLGDPLQR
jgi:hypothetical protein